eukprot:2997909-Amphidinium_carterae.1
MGSESSFGCLEENKEATRMVLKVRQSLKAESEKEKLMFSKMTRSIGFMQRRKYCVPIPFRTQEKFLKK